MAHIKADRVRETTTTTGVGAVTLAGAVSGFRIFGSVMANADTCFYAIALAPDWETGLGTWGTGGILTRTTVLASSNAGAAVSFGAGSKDVFITSPASRTATFDGDLGVVMPGIVAEPATPASGNLTFYAKAIAGRMFPKVKGPSGLDYPLQASFWQNNICLWSATNAAVGVWLGTVGAGAGTFTSGLPTTTSIYTTTRRSRYANVVTTTNQVLGQRNTDLMFMRGASAGQGGFFFYARCGMDVWTNGGRFFAGMHVSTNVVTADPSATSTACGFCIDAADNGAISFLTRDGTTPTKASTGFTMVTGKGYDLYMFCAPNSSAIGWRIVDINTGSEASGSATATLPTATTLHTAGVLAGNAALITVTAIHLGINRIYVETDY